LGTLADIGLMSGAAALAVLGLYLLLRLLRRRRARLAQSAPRVSAQQLRSWLDQGFKPTLVDVRSAASIVLDPRRIPGALAIELKDIAARAGEIPPNVPVVLYCNCPNEESAAQAARLLRKAGVLDCRLLAGGLDAWGTSGGVLEVPRLRPSPGSVL
jgi:rhodanese-related sulfurtransferase